MSRPFRLLTLSLAALSLTAAGCRTSTPYTSMYSPRKNYYSAPPQKSEKSAEELLKATEAARPTGPTTELPPGLPPAVPPPTTPPADPLAPAVPPPAAPQN